jgi:hypothetical protein
MVQSADPTALKKLFVLLPECRSLPERCYPSHHRVTLCDVDLNDISLLVLILPTTFKISEEEKRNAIGAYSCIAFVGRRRRLLRILKMGSGRRHRHLRAHLDYSGGLLLGWRRPCTSLNSISFGQHWLAVVSLRRDLNSAPSSFHACGQWIEFCQEQEEEEQKRATVLFCEWERERRCEVAPPALWALRSTASRDQRRIVTLAEEVRHQLVKLTVVMGDVLKPTKKSDSDRIAISECSLSETTRTSPSNIVESFTRPFCMGREADVLRCRASP